MDEQVAEYLGSQGAMVEELAQKTRELLISNAPQLRERYYDGYKMLIYGKPAAGNDQKLSDQRMYIALQNGYVNLGFTHGTLLPDPQHLLRGAGKTGRHVKIKKVEDLQNPELAALIKAAASQELCYSMGGRKPALFYKQRKEAMMRAIFSVWDKRGIVELAQGLAEAAGGDLEIYSTGKTKAALEQAGMAVKSISELTGFPEIMDGRVKTLHPAVYSGLLARRDKPEHMAALAELGLPTIDVLVVNLYPFVETISKPDTDLETAIENIDIGGPAMIRAAAKNHESVIVLVDAADYDAVVAEMRDGEVGPQTRRRLAAKAYQHTASYDTYIAQYLRSTLTPALTPALSPAGKREAALTPALSPAGEREKIELPEAFSVALHRVQEMRYGENPHQGAAVYADSLGRMAGTLIGNLKQLNGKQLSYNNILDADAALEVVRDFAAPTVAIIKHNNPCGLASGDDLRDDYARALAGDPVSAFGGIVAVNRPVDAALAEDIAATFYEVVIAPSFSNAAVDTLARKKNLRVLAVGEAATQADPLRSLQMRQVSGGFLVQDRDVTAENDVPMQMVTTAHPTLEQVNDLLFAWRAVKHVKSNAIVLARGRAMVGAGAGQPNRVDSVRLAVTRAGERAEGSVLASDAYFPFADNIEVAVKAGVKAIIQPGGSVRDGESIAMAEQYGIAMVFTGRRHFKH